MADERKKDACRSCSAPIEWAVSEKSGKAVPLDFEPVSAGNISIVATREDGVGIARFMSKKNPVVGDRLSHFVTCPDASKHRAK